MSRSKRLYGVANAAPRFLGHLKVAGSIPQLQLFESLVLLFLIADVLANRRLVSAHRGNEVPPRPEVLADEVPLPLAVHPRQVDRTLPLDETDHLLHRILRRNRNQHVDVIGHQMPLLNPALLLRGQFSEHLAQMAPQLLVQRPAAALGDKHYVIFALPLGVA